MKKIEKFFFGKVMAEAQGKASPKLLQEAVADVLGKHYDSTSSITK